jgi:subtilase family serine protease
MMKRRWLVGLVLCGAALLGIGPAVPPAAAQQPPGFPPGANQPTLPAVVPVCNIPARINQARCHSHRRVDRAGNPHAPSQASGYSPSQLQTAYALTTSSTAGVGQTVAIVDAYDHPNAESDLNAYRSRFGLGACTTGNGCFRKVDQDGGTSYPAFDSGWAQEIALDIQMVSAICPRCSILLVEARTNSFDDLGIAVQRAASLGATAISNSYGAGEFSTEASYEAPYHQPGIAVTVSSGDAGYGVEFPAASRYVTAVGGTSLVLTSADQRSSETVWSGAGSGCSQFIPKPAWQKDAGCGRRTVADVAAVANPSTGVLVYYNGGWYIFGGTSVAAPIIASVYALAGNAATLGENVAGYPYGHTASLYDVTSGSNGQCAAGPKKSTIQYLCTGVAGYDGPTGLGAPKGSGAF